MADRDSEKKTFAPEEREAHKREKRVAGSLGSLLSGLGSGKSEGGGTDESARTNAGAVSNEGIITSDYKNGSNFGTRKNNSSRWSDFGKKNNPGGSNSLSQEKNLAMGWFAAGETMEGGDSQQGRALGKDEFQHWGEARMLDEELDPEWLSYEHKKLDERFGEGIITVKYTGDGTLGFYCELCFATMNNMKPLEAHCSGMKHLKKKDMFEKNKASGEPSLVGRRKEDPQGSLPPLGSERDHPSRDERDRLHMNPRDRLGRDGRDRYPRDERDRYYRDERDRYYRDERDRYPRDERDSYSRDEWDRYPRDEYDRYPRDERDRYSRDAWDLYSRDDRDRAAWDRYPRDDPDRHSRDAYDRRDYNSADRQIPYTVDYKHQDKRPRLDGPDDIRPSSFPMRVPTPPPARLSPPALSRPPISTPDTNLSGGPAAALLTKLAQCTVKNDNDANLASDVINMLLKSLKEYHAKEGEKTVADLMEQAEIKLGTAKAIRSVKKTTPSQPLDAISAAMQTLRQGSANFPSLI